MSHIPDQEQGMSDKEKLFGLLEVAEEHSAQVQALLDRAYELHQQAIAAEQGVVKAQKQALLHLNDEAKAVMISLDQHAQTIHASLAQSNSEAIHTMLEDTADQHLQQLQERLTPLQTRLDQWQQQLDDNAQFLRYVSRYFARKAMWLAVAVATSVSLAIVAATWLAVEHERQQLKILEQDQQALQQNISTLKTINEEWEKKQGRLQLHQCGDAQRLCIRVETLGRYGDNNDYMVIKGY